MAHSNVTSAISRFYRFRRLIEYLCFVSIIVQAGMKVVKSDEGFYQYEAGSKDLVVIERFR